MVFYDLEWLSICRKPACRIMVSDRLVALDYPFAIGIQLAGGIASNMGWNRIVFANEAGRNRTHCSLVRWNFFRDAPQIVLPLRSRSSDFTVRSPLDTLAFMEPIS